MLTGGRQVGWSIGKVHKRTWLSSNLREWRESFAWIVPGPSYHFDNAGLWHNTWAVECLPYSATKQPSPIDSFVSPRLPLLMPMLLGFPDQSGKHLRSTYRVKS